MPVSALLLDLGGVLLDLHVEATLHAFEAGGCVHFREWFSLRQQIPVFDAWDKGEITDTAFRDYFRTRCPMRMDDARFDHCWNAMLGNLPAHRLELLRVLGRNYRLFLLSNTNFIHLHHFREQIRKEHGILLDDCFEKAYYSCRLGMRKPEPGIYDLVVKENRLNPSETLFIDDGPAQVEGARRAGLQARVLPAGMELKVLLEELLGTKLP